MLLIDSLKTVKEKAEFKNYYLDNDKQLTTPIVEQRGLNKKSYLLVSFSSYKLVLYLIFVTS